MSIELINVSYTYSKGTPLARKGLSNVHLKIADGEWVAVMGPTGSGKSTLLQHLNGLLRPDTGQVLVDGKDIHANRSRLRDARKNVGLVFQYPEHQLFGATVLEEVAYGPKNFGCSGPDVEARVMAAMHDVGLDYGKYKDRPPLSLSGGEKRRAALAGVLAAGPEVIAFDEPTAGLDMAGKQALIETVTRLNREHGITVIWITHEIGEIAALAGRLLVLNEGRVVLDGPVRDTLADPLIGELGLDVPVPVAVAEALRKKGRPVEGRPVTVDEIKREILRLVR